MQRENYANKQLDLQMQIAIGLAREYKAQPKEPPSEVGLFTVWWHLYDDLTAHPVIRNLPRELAESTCKDASGHYPDQVYCLYEQTSANSLSLRDRFRNGLSIGDGRATE
jgi:hypothetical protein